ncbi:hypothetical protein [Methanosarcina barkeri]|nr:hypothetical protein [Methanosarcina barkeri]
MTDEAAIFRNLDTYDLIGYFVGVIYSTYGAKNKYSKRNNLSLH